MRLVSLMENEGTIMLDSVGNFLAKGKEISIRERDINNPDIQYVINNKMAKIVDEKDKELKIKPQFEAGDTVTMYCPLNPDMTLTLDSIKASCHGCQSIEIDKREMENNDIREAIREGWLVEQKEETKKEEKKVEAKKETKKKMATSLKESIFDEDDEETEDDNAFIDLDSDSGFEDLASSVFDEVSMDDVKISDKKKAVPKKKRAKRKTAAKKKTAKKTKRTTKRAKKKE